MKDHVSYSQLRSWQRCAWRAHLVYEDGLFPKVKKAGLRQGTIADAGMNALYKGVKETGVYDLDLMLDAMQDAARAESERIRELDANLTQEDWDALREELELLEGVASHYVRWAEENDDFRVIANQLEGKVPVIADTGRASSKYDFVWRADRLVVKDGRLWIVEDKWWKVIASDALRMLPYDEQTLEYLWAFNLACRRDPKQFAPEVQAAVRTYGPPLGIIYNVVRKKLPRTPELLKKGGLSKAANIDTTYEEYLRAIKWNGLDEADYADVLANLEAKGNTFFHREEIYFSDEELLEVQGRVYELSRLRSEGFRFKHRTRECAWECAYLPLCIEWSEELLEAGYHYSYEEPEPNEKEEDLAA